MTDANMIAMAIEVVWREFALFAAVGFLLLGIGDLLVDFIWLAIVVRRRVRRRGTGQACAASLTAPLAPGAIAIFVPAWDEAAVIADMLAYATRAFAGSDHRIYVGCYPNDPATIAAVRGLDGPGVRLVVGPMPGPTSKADCLNRLWEAMCADEAAEGRRFKAVVLHDAEDIVHCSWPKILARNYDEKEPCTAASAALIACFARWRRRAIDGHSVALGPAANAAACPP